MRKTDIYFKTGPLVLACREKTGIKGHDNIYICHTIEGGSVTFGLWIIFGKIKAVATIPGRDALNMPLDKLCEWLETDAAIARIMR